jgi:hypothetical protein
LSNSIVEELEKFIPSKEPRKWAKLASTINYRRLQLLLLKEILVELREIKAILEKEAIS